MFCVIYRFPTHVAENNLFSFSLYSLTWYCICNEFGVHFFLKTTTLDCTIYRLPLRSICKRKGKGGGKGERERRKEKGERRKEMCVWCMRAFVWLVCVCAYDLGWIALFRLVLPGEPCYLQLAVCILCLPK